MRPPEELRSMEPEELLERLGSNPTVPRRGWIIAGGVALVLAVAAWLVVTRGPDEVQPSGPTAVADQFLAAWSSGDQEAISDLIDGDSTPEEVIFQMGFFDQALDIRSIDAVRSGNGTSRGNELDVKVEVELELAGMEPWAYDTTLTLSDPGSTNPRVAWDRSFLHPQLNEKTSIRRSAPRWDERSQVLGLDDTELYQERPAVIVGMIPAWVPDIDLLADGVAKYAPITPDDVREIYNADPETEDFVEIVIMERNAYDIVKADLRPINGAVFEPGRQLPDFFARLPPSTPFATSLLGSVVPPSENELLKFGLPYGPNNLVGRGGIEAEYEYFLAGRPDQAVELLDSDGVILEVLHGSASLRPQPVRTTIDVDIQLAAERAVTGVEFPVTLVAVDGRTGGIRASATRQAESPDWITESTRVPGSIFSVVTAMALLESGVTAETPTDCTDRLTIGDVTVTNDDGRVPSRGTFGDAVIRSCTTALVSLAHSTVSPADIAAAASSLGIGSAVPIGLPRVTGVLDEVEGDELVLQMAGRDGVEVTVLEMATAAAAIAADALRPTELVLVPSPSEAVADGELPSMETTSLPQAGAMRELMRRAIAEGTGGAAGIEGFDVGGLTGTEQGVGGPVAGWFIGFSEDLGVAVMVEGPARGGELAAPIAGDFFQALRQG